MVVAQAVFRSGRITYHRIIGAILLYLLIAVTFATLFAFVGLSISDSFKGIAFEDDAALASSLFYLSFVTLSSTGYGDIVPLHPLARSLCNIESIIGQLYPATILARLVTFELESNVRVLYSRHANASRPRHTGGFAALRNRATPGVLLNAWKTSEVKSRFPHVGKPGPPSAGERHHLFCLPAPSKAPALKLRDPNTPQARQDRGCPHPTTRYKLSYTAHERQG